MWMQNPKNIFHTMQDFPAKQIYLFFVICKRTRCAIFNAQATLQKKVKVFLFSLTKDFFTYSLSHIRFQPDGNSHRANLHRQKPLRSIASEWANTNKSQQTEWRMHRNVNRCTLADSPSFRYICTTTPWSQQSIFNLGDSKFATSLTTWHHFPLKNRKYSC